jgi:hypothetical protein
MCPSNTPPLSCRRGGVYPVLVPRYMLVPRYVLVPRDTVRSMHKVMRLVHGRARGLLGSLLGHTHPLLLMPVSYEDVARYIDIA